MKNSQIEPESSTTESSLKPAISDVDNLSRTSSTASDMSDDGEEHARRNFEINFPNTDPPFMSNKVSTGKYSIWTFLPKNLFIQCSKMANFYFIMMTCLQLYRPIAQPGGAYTTFMCVVFICGVSSIKDAFEDAKRHKSDEEENKRTCEFLPFGGRQFVKGKGEDIKVG